MNILKKIKNYITEVRTEARKVSWPSRKTALKDSFIVIGISLATAAFLGGVDYALNLIMEKIIAA